jgi:hypothetical protein
MSAADTRSVVGSIRLGASSMYPNLWPARFGRAMVAAGRPFAPSSASRASWVLIRRVIPALTHSAPGAFGVPFRWKAPRMVPADVVAEE